MIISLARRIAKEFKKVYLLLNSSNEVIKKNEELREAIKNLNLNEDEFKIMTMEQRFNYLFSSLKSIQDKANETDSK